CSGYWKSPAYVVGRRKFGFGVLFAIVPVKRAAVNVDGLSALNRLKTSPIASTRDVPTRRNDFDTRRFNDDSDAPRPQLIVAQVPRLFTIALLFASRPSNANASVGMSLLAPF